VTEAVGVWRRCALRDLLIGAAGFAGDADESPLWTKRSAMAEAEGTRTAAGVEDTKTAWVEREPHIKSMLRARYAAHVAAALRR